jgi:ABC-type glutathione transport system ATPase component
MVTSTCMPLLTRGSWSEVSRATALPRRRTVAVRCCWLRPWRQHGRVTSHGAVDHAGNGLAAERLSHSSGADRAVFDVASAVVPGQIHLVAGLNGDGKTTVIWVSSGMLRPDKGRAFILACDLSHGTSDLWRRAGHMVNASLGYPKLTVEETPFEAASGHNGETPSEQAV